MQNLSAKELTALGEQLGGEEMLVSKYTAMAGQATDPKIAQTFQGIASKHQRHYNELKKFLG